MSRVLLIEELSKKKSALISSESVSLYTDAVQSPYEHVKDGFLQNQFFQKQQKGKGVKQMSSKYQIFHQLTSHYMYLSRKHNFHMGGGGKSGLLQVVACEYIYWIEVKSGLTEQ